MPSTIAASPMLRAISRPLRAKAVETYLGHGIDRFPEDIFTYDANGARVGWPLL